MDPGEWTHSHETTQWEWDPTLKKKKARQINPLQNTNEVFVSFSKIN